MTAVPRASARGDTVWIDFDPRAGREQAGRRPAVVLSPLAYNRMVGFALLCPITGRSGSSRLTAIREPRHRLP